MKFSVITLLWTTPFDTSKLDYVQRVADLGFDAIECPIEQPGLMDPGALKEALDKAGIEGNVAMAFSPDRDVSSTDADLRQGGIAYVKHCIDFAQQIGSGLVSGPAYAATGRCELLDDGERAAELDRAVEGLKECADYAGERGVRIAIEPLNRFETHLVNTAEQGLELCERIGDNAGLLLDTFHMNIEEKHLGDAIRATGDRLFLFHSCENDRGTPGSGHVQWGEVAAALNGIDYDGTVAIESFIPGIEELARAVSMWRPIFTDGDEMARDGLAFLKRELAA